MRFHMICCLGLAACVSTITGCTGPIAGAAESQDVPQVQASNTSTEVNLGAIGASMTDLHVTGDRNDLAVGSGASNEGDLANSSEQHASSEFESSTSTDATTTFSIDDSTNAGGAAIGPIDATLEMPSSISGY